MLAKLAPVLGMRGDVAEAREAYEYAIGVLRESDPFAAAPIMRSLSQAMWARGNIAQSEQLAEEGIAILERDPRPDLVGAYGGAAHQLAIAGHPQRAMAYVEKGLALAEELGVADVVALLQARATARGYDGDPGAVDDLRESVDLGLRLGLGRATAVAMNNLADGLSVFESMHAGRAAWDEGIEFSRARGLDAAAIWCRGERLRALYHLGEWGELEQEAGEVLGWVEERGGGQLAVFAHVELAQLLVHRGQLALAAEHVDALLPWARESGDPQVLVPGLTAAALVAWRGANDRDALELVREIEEKTRKEGGWRSASLTWPARIATASGWFELLDLFLDRSEQASAWDSCARPAALAGLAEARGRVRGGRRAVSARSRTLGRLRQRRRAGVRAPRARSLR